MARRYCQGDPVCVVCGAACSAELVQICPAPAALRRAGARGGGRFGPPPLQVPCTTCDEPGLVGKAASWLRAVARWRRARRPVRSQSQVDALLAICQACPHLKEAGTERQRCGVCGCPLSARLDKPTANKLAMATERCPLDPPRWT